MVRVNVIRIIALLAVVQLVISVPRRKTKKYTIRNVERPKIEEIKIRHRIIEKRKKAVKDDRSTSSSSGTPKEGRDSGDSGSSDSLREDISEESSSTSGDKPKSSAERRGWRKWHRKCPSCPEDMKKKWRDPSINWICGTYQNARRTFKSLCMMHYRNCQDGTMFTKVHDHMCDDDITSPRRHGEHFFYDYKVTLSEDSSEESSNLSSRDSESDTS